MVVTMNDQIDGTSRIMFLMMMVTTEVKEKCAGKDPRVHECANRDNCPTLSPTRTHAEESRRRLEFGTTPRTGLPGAPC